MSLVIGNGTSVTLHFSLALEDGELIDSNFDAEPVQFSVGDGNLLPGFEQALFGLCAGDEQTFVIPPEKAFGQHNPQNLQRVVRDNFDEDALVEGAIFSFQNGDGELPGVVSEISDSEVVVDFNHPLAGHSIQFCVSIIAVTAETLH